MSEPRRWELAFRDLPANDNTRRRWHWTERAKHDRYWKDLAGLAARALGIPRLHRVRLSAVIYRRALGVADESGDRGRLKQLEDGLVLAGVVPSDTRGHVEWGEVSEARGTPGVLLIVEALE